MERIHQREKLFNRICAGVLIAFALLWLIPLAWAVDTALKPNAETTNTTWLIENPTFDAFTRTLRDTDILELVRRLASSSRASPPSAPSSRRAWPRSPCPGCGSGTRTSSSG